MKLYTIIAEFGGTTFVDQLKSKSVIDALKFWVSHKSDHMIDTLGHIGFKGNEYNWGSEILNKSEEDINIFKIENMQSVYFADFLESGSLIVIHIIITEES